MEATGHLEKKEMGMRLQEIRQGAGLSQSGLAAAAGVPVGTLRNWEQGRRMPLLDTAARVAAALGCSLDELVRAPKAAPPAAERKPARKRKAPKPEDN
jgi:transcriptional regulator with XRE-family HTH domain